MRAGELRERISIERPVVDQDPDTGISTHAWQAVVLDEPARMAPVTGREFFSSDQRQSLVTVKALIRYRPDIDPSFRVVHQGVNYAIRAVLTDETFSRYQWLMLERGGTDGN